MYTERDPATLSWHEARPSISLELIERIGLPPSAAILDAGGGSSTLAGELARRGYRDITVVDISPAALSHARAELGDAAAAITFLTADLRAHRFDRQYHLWHDRAVFHFMVDRHDRDAYLTTLAHSLRPDGHLILATFGPDGPTRCSGLPVNRYSDERLTRTLGSDFTLVTSRTVDHTTPSGATQQFLYGYWRRAATDVRP
jgi:SAM-dependent methyltransferase